MSRDPSSLSTSEAGPPPSGISPASSSVVQASTSAARSSGGHTVVVTGAATCLGQHIIRQIHKRANYINAIRIFERQPFVHELEYQLEKPTDIVPGNILCYEDLLPAFRGTVTTCFHLAVTEDRRMFCDMKTCKKFNIEGTQNIIRACQAHGVKNLIFVTGADVVMGLKDIHMGNAINRKYPDQHLFPDAVTKQTAEEEVLKANDLGALNTVVLRPVDMYGELDKRTVPRLIQLAYKNYGDLLCVGDGKSQLQMVYVGNVAWAILCAERKTYIIADDTPPENIFRMVHPVLRRYGFYKTKWFLPENYAKTILKIVKVILWLLSPFRSMNPELTYELVHYWCHTYTFNDAESRAELGYKPIYTPEHSWKRTTLYLDNKFKLALVDFIAKNILSKTGHVEKLLVLDKLKREVTKDYTERATRYSVAAQPAPSRMARLLSALTGRKTQEADSSQNP